MPHALQTERHCEPSKRWSPDAVPAQIVPSKSSAKLDTVVLSGIPSNFGKRFATPFRSRIVPLYEVPIQRSPFEVARSTKTSVAAGESPSIARTRSQVKPSKRY